MKKLIATIALGVMTLASVASAQQPQSLPVVTTRSNDNTLTVENQRAVPVTLWVANGQSDRRLGIVAPGATSTLALPDWVAWNDRPIQIVARASDEVVSRATRPFVPERPARLTLVVQRAEPAAPTWADTMATYVDASDRDETTVTVDNPRDVPCVITAEPGVFQVKLGQIPAGGRMTLTVPRTIVAGDRMLRLYVRPQGGLPLASEYVTLRQGQHLAVKVPAK